MIYDKVKNLSCTNPDQIRFGCLAGSHDSSNNEYIAGFCLISEQGGCNPGQDAYNNCNYC